MALVARPAQALGGPQGPDGTRSQFHPRPPDAQGLPAPVGHFGPSTSGNHRVAPPATAKRSRAHGELLQAGHGAMNHAARCSVLSSTTTRLQEYL